jgi:hypothetical protein
VNKAYECKVEYSRDGKCIRRERSVGAVVPGSIVALIGLWTGTTLFNPPLWFWQLLRSLLP